jgi:predicted acyl esterase
MSDGVEINADIFRPDIDEAFPAIFGFHPYNQMAQTAPITTQSFSINFFKNPGQEEGNAYIEAPILKQETLMPTSREDTSMSLPMSVGPDSQEGNTLFLPIRKHRTVPRS